MTEKRDIFAKIFNLIPAVEKPKFRLPFMTRLKWVGIVLLLYFLLSSIRVIGIEKRSYEQFRFYEIVMGSRFGSLATLGIGPIVTAGIILQLLVGSKIINWDLTKPEDRKKFETWDKFLAVLFCFVEGFAYVLSGAIPVEGGLPMVIFVGLQLAFGGFLIILLDEIVSKWGFGSGVSLFIAAGVSSQIFIRLFSILPATCQPGVLATCIPSFQNPPSGLIWNLIGSLISQNLQSFLVTLLPIVATLFVFFLVTYVQGITVEIPLAFGGLRGFGRSWPLRLLYTSNIPVILTAALMANLQLFGRFGAVPQGDLLCSPLACYDQSGRIVSGILYYFTAPRNFLEEIIWGTVTSSEIIRVIGYLSVFVIFSTIFSVFWVSTSGMDPESVAKQIVSFGFYIPGYRKSEKVIESVLRNYIPNLAVLGGFLIGLIAATANLLGAIGSGTGILLTVMIINNFYEILTSQRVEEAPTFIRRLLGVE